MSEKELYKAALTLIAAIGCMQSESEEEFFCKKDGSKHSAYCPAGIALQALSGEADFSKAIETLEILAKYIKSREEPQGVKYERW